MSTSTVTGVVRLPVYELLPTEALKGLEDAATATTVSTDEAGDYFNMVVARKVPVAEVRHNAIIVVPMSATVDGTAMTSTSLAAGGRTNTVFRGKKCMMYASQGMT